MDESRRCTATNRQGDRCKLPAIVGGTVCRSHGGRAPQVRAAAARRVERSEIEVELSRLGVPVEVDQGEALMRLIYEANGNVAYYRDRIGRLQAEGDDVYGSTYHATGVETGEAKPHVLVSMYDAERDRLGHLCQLALRVGLDERRVRLAETELAASIPVLDEALAEALAANGVTGDLAAVVLVSLAAGIRRRMSSLRSLP